VGRNAQIALAVGIGYLLGRRRKLRTALTFGAAAAVGRLSTDPQALLKQGSKLLGTSPRLGQVANLSKPLATAGKAAAAAAVSHGIDSVGDRIRRRADVLRGGEQAGAPLTGRWPSEGEAEQGEAEQGRAERGAGAEPEEDRLHGETSEAYEGEVSKREEAPAEGAEAEEPQQAEEEPEEPRPARRRAARPTPTARARRRPAEEATEEAPQPPVRRTPRGRPGTGGAPVRRGGGDR
jgi:hypothetical protein